LGKAYTYLRMAGVGGTIGPLQLVILAILIIMTLTGLYYTGTGETIPNTVMLGFAVGILAVVLGVFQSFGGFTQAKEEDPEKEADNLFEKKKEKRDQKRTKKEAAKAQEEAEVELEKAAKKAAKLQAQKIAKMEAKQEADAKKLEEEKKKQEEEEKKAKKAKKPKKPKKEKEIKEAAPSEVVEKEETKASEIEDWVVQPSQKEIREAKKANKDEPTIDVDMLVNSKHYPALIGEAGAVRTKIEEVCAVKLTFPRRNSGDEKIKLEGTASAVALTKQVINEIIDKGYSSTLDANATDCKISVSASCVGLLLANKAAHMKVLRAKTLVRVEIPEKEKEVKERPKESKEKGKKGDKDVKEEAEKPERAVEKPPIEITLFGDANGIARAVEAIRQLETEGYSDLTHEGHTKTVVAFPASLIGTLMGQKGQQLQAIQKRTGARIQIPPLEKENKPTLIEITLVGKPAEVEAARREIVAISTDFLTHEVDIPQSLVFLLFAGKGAEKKALQQRTNTRIDVGPHLWDPTLKTISISGADKAIQVVVQEITNLVSQNTILKMEFPADRLPALIGKAGQNLQKIQNETGVHIDCDDHEWDTTVKIVTVVGTAAALKEAEKALELVIRPPPKEPKPAPKPTKGEGKRAPKGGEGKEAPSPVEASE